MPRMFIAIEPTGAVKTALAALRLDMPGCKWTPLEQIHLTLRFLGDVSPGAAKALQYSLANIRVAPFELLVRGVGTFPGFGSRQHPRVLWAGVAPAAGLEQLWREINAAANQLKLEGDESARGFAPHLTIARLKGKPAPQLAGLIRRNEHFTAPVMAAREFVLFESELRREGAVHRPVETFELL
ncbi:MAG: RNA 2',3'-cyclic phosphodiesterase [Planctomycetes bacterium]|nr:RNA 2',3'-cyclic phosphodiesterase [Planctomycetota bacterium]